MGFEGRDYALNQKSDKIFNDLIGHYETVIGKGCGEAVCVKIRFLTLALCRGFFWLLKKLEK